MLTLKKLLFAVALSVAGALTAVPAIAADAPTTVVLVHGAFADGSSWSRVIPLLQSEGLNVVAVQNPLSAFGDDVATTKRAIERAPGPVVLVGHSYGGMVITQAGVEDKVKALVYVAAFALPKGQSINSASAGSQPAPWAKSLQRDSASYLWIPADTLGTYFAQDVSKEEVAVVAAAQSPTFAGVFDGRLTEAAYETKPSWFVIPDADGAIPPKLQHKMAAAIHADTTDLQASHVVAWTKPREVADVIIKAVKSVNNNGQ